MESVSSKFFSPSDEEQKCSSMCFDESGIHDGQDKVQDPEMQTSRSTDWTSDEDHLTEVFKSNSSLDKDAANQLTISVQYPYADARAPKPEKATKKRYPRKRDITKSTSEKIQRREEFPADQQGKPNKYVVFPVEQPTAGHNLPKNGSEMNCPKVKVGLSKKKATQNAQAHALRQRQRRCRAGKAFSKLREMLPGIEPRANQSKVIDYLAAYLRYFNTIVHSSDIETYHTYFSDDLIAGKIDPFGILGISHEAFLRNLFPQSNLMESTAHTKENAQDNETQNCETKDILMRQFAAHFSKLHETLDVSENDAQAMLI